MLKKLILTGFAFGVVSILSFGQASLEGSECQGGGPSSTSCSASYWGEATVMGSGGSFSQSASVSCGTGYYACCNAGPTSGATANCRPN